MSTLNKTIVSFPLFYFFIFPIQFHHQFPLLTSDTSYCAFVIKSKVNDIFSAYWGLI